MSSTWSPSFLFSHVCEEVQFSGASQMDLSVWHPCSHMTTNTSKTIILKVTFDWFILFYMFVYEGHVYWRNQQDRTELRNLRVRPGYVWMKIRHFLTFTSHTNFTRIGLFVLSFFRRLVKIFHFSVSSYINEIKKFQKKDFSNEFF